MAGDQEWDQQLGARIRAARAQSGLSLRTLAGRLQVSPATLSQIETGKVGLSARRLVALAGVLQVPVAALAEGSPGPTQRWPQHPAPTSPEADLTTAPTPAGARPGRAAAPPPALTEPADWRLFPPLRLDPVLAAAFEGFLEVGFHGTSIRDIARRCGLSVPGVYHYYAGKQDMLVALLDRVLTDMLARARACVRGVGDPVGRFARLIECLALVHTYHADLAFIGASEMRSLLPAHLHRMVAMRVEQQRMVDREVRAGVEDGSFGTDNPHDAARAAVTMCTAIPQWYRPDGSLPPERIAGRYVGFALGLVDHRADAPPHPL